MKRLLSIFLILIAVSCAPNAGPQHSSAPPAPQAAVPTPTPTPASPAPGVPAPPIPTAPAANPSRMPIQAAPAPLQYELNTGLVSAFSGNVPIIITAPHGGTRHTTASGTELKKRTIGQRVSDSKTDELTLELKNYLEHNSDIRPYYIIANFHREYVDANRPKNVEQAVPTAHGSFVVQNLQCYDEYHKAIADTIEYLNRLGHQKILLLDIHGTGVKKPLSDGVYLGTLCDNGCVNARSDATTIQLDSQNIRTNFMQKLGSEINPAFVASGRDTTTRRAVEITERNRNDSKAHKLTGGWTIRKYYKVHNKVSAIQLEHGSRLRKEDWQRAAMARALGESIKNMSTHGYGKLPN